MNIWKFGKIRNIYEIITFKHLGNFWKNSKIEFCWGNQRAGVGGTTRAGVGGTTRGVFLLIRVSRRRWGAGGGTTRGESHSGAFRH